MRLRLLLLWHLHQPSYVDPETGRAVLPWVRLHAARGYTDMARLAREFPEIHQTFNLTPVLLEQLEGLASGAIVDEAAELARRPAGELEPADRRYLLRNFFSVAFEHNIRPLPRYAALLARREKGAFGVADLRDLQVLFHLAWFGHTARDLDDGIAALWRKGGGYSEADKAYVLATVDRMVKGVVPAYRALAEAGNVELTTTPYHHPILPLLCDSDVARRALPNRPLPPRFEAVDDAREQVARAVSSHASRLGAAPGGMWPAEGSVSPEVVPLFEEADVAWIATDEGILMRSVPASLSREAALFRPWRLPGGGGKLVGFFRDHGLSDKIGFDYQRMSAEASARDFVGHLERIARAAPAGEIPMVTVILDGENPWEHYPRSGRDHLVALFRAIRDARWIETLTFSEALAAAPPREALPRLHSGSWIDGSFRIWIGGEEENRAWALLGEARERLRARGGAGAARAREHLLVAEGSDWFWWYGDDFASDQKPEFDRLFRARIAAAYREMGDGVPAAVLEPIARPRPVRPVRAPTSLIHPELGSPNVLSWLGAGRYETAASRGSMHGGEPVFAALEYGFDLEHLYVRLLPRALDWAPLVREVRLLLVAGPRQHEVLLWPEAGDVYAGRTLEGKVAFSRIGVQAGDEIGLAVAVQPTEGPAERYPPLGVLSLQVPDESFERRNWWV